MLFIGPMKFVVVMGLYLLDLVLEEHVLRNIVLAEFVEIPSLLDFLAAQEELILFGVAARKGVAFYIGSMFLLHVIPLRILIIGAEGEVPPADGRLDVATRIPARNAGQLFTLLHQ